MREDKIVDALVEHISERSKVSLGQMRGKSRKENVVFARLYISYKLRSLGYKLQQIADILNVTHPSVMYYLKTYESLKTQTVFKNFLSQMGDFGQRFLIDERDLDRVVAELSEHMDREMATHIINQLRK